ncbi:NAD(P)-binding protein [Cryphonectria parasitica EP155]|uniref:NAD(P)-binding protein n=1 Tax=Cryphonectria parasitica (strain ATCC 38755 / EP155) TaxID=660469 RepID=A0A9P4XX88_CRYP1|nr:NAD(P)-binding protein [Cryphonectria parasitica EP155]KAF3762240.1 NAD(P)-binding protein [Cryphonectria parasitica EP155]
MNPTPFSQKLDNSYVGGDIAHALQQKHPDYDYTYLVRSEERAKLVKSKYPEAKIVYGSLDDSAVIEKAASEADIVIHTANSADDAPSVQAITKGLEAGHTAEKPGYWLHTSGTGELLFRDIAENRYGQPPYPDEKYDDLADIQKILNLSDEAFHRTIDKAVQAANSSPAIRTAIVCPPTIYGTGRGTGNTRSIQVPDLIKFALQNGLVPVVGTGLTEWDHVHVHDLADLFVRLVEAAQDPATAGDAEVFGEQAYYFAEAGVHKWGDVAKWVADELVKQGFMAEPKVETTTIEFLNDQVGFVAATWALNSKSFASRARKHLGWKPTREHLKDSIAEAISVEAKKLGIEPQAA